MPPPGIFLIPMSVSSRSSWSRVRTASTTMLEKKGFWPWMSFDDMAVEAHLRSRSRKSLVTDTG